jgi:hypothetical protein
MSLFKSSNYGTEKSEKIQISKSEVFKKAWGLVKEIGINLSNALKISWLELKLSKLYKEYNQGGLVTTEKWKIEKRIAPLSKTLLSLKPCKIDFEPKVISNDGAIHWYGIGVYNGD